MVALSALLTTLFLSPFFFGLLTGLGIALLALRRRRAAAWLLSSSLVLLLALSTAPVRNTVLGPLEHRYLPFPAEAPPIDAIVVLGGGVVDGAPDEGGGASLADDSFKRLVYGFILYRRTGAPVIVSGGRVWKREGTESEADAAAATLKKLGVPEGLIIKEGRSRTTWENALEVSRMLSPGKGGRIALVTSAYHMPRAMLAFSKAGISCVPAPTGYLSETRRLAVVDLLPSFGSLESSFKALREYLGLVMYALRR